MEHFSTQKWIDFVRGTAESPLVTTIQQHLAKGCPECLKNEKTWRHVMEATKKLSSLEPPETALHAVKGAAEVQVRMANGDVFDQVELLGSDERRDVAADEPVVVECNS